MNKKVIVALDLSNIKKTISLVQKLKNEVYAFKIGHEFFYTFGIEGYKKIYKICPKIFLDLKLNDIPNTVEKGISAISKLKPTFTTIHISGGDEMQKAAMTKKNKFTKVLGVTVLTSLNKNQTKVKIKIASTSKNYIFELKNPRKFNFKTFSAIKDKEFVKKITF